MNIQHLRYAVEIDRQGSISKAAEALYMNQPNLSKAMRELEQTLGVTLFTRTSKGVVTTAEGASFLSYARGILAQIDEVESLYRTGPGRRSFRISVPRSSYIAAAFTGFVSQLDMDKAVEVYFSETNSMQAIRNILDNNFKLGVIRYRAPHEPYFLSFLTEHGLSWRTILEYESRVLLSVESPLAAKPMLCRSDLEGLFEIVHGDLQIPNLPRGGADEPVGPHKRIYVYERGSQLDLLTRNPNTYMWVSPMPADILARGNLAERRCGGGDLRHKDMLVHPKGYRCTPLEREFVRQLESAAAEAKRTM